MRYFAADHHGALLLPEGRDLVRNSRSFKRDWLEFLRQWKIWKADHPLKQIEDWLWEQEKNAWRKWWYSHTPGERQYMLDRRDDTQVRIFQPKYGLRRFQRGNFAMFPAGTVAQDNIGRALNLGSAGNSATNVEFSPGGPLDAGFGLINNGQHNRVDSDGTNQVDTDEWINVNPEVDVGDDYEVEWNQLTGIALNDESYTEATWTTINVGTGNGRYVGQSTAAAAQVKTFEIDIGDVGTSTSDINQDYSVEAGELV